MEFELLVGCLLTAPAQFWFSVGVTITHSLHEALATPPIWAWLSIPMILYWLVQALHLALAWLGVLCGYWGLALVLIGLRLADAFYVHDVREAVHGLSPGRDSALLLVLDAAVLASFLFLSP